MTPVKTFEGCDLPYREFDNDPEKAITGILEFLGLPHMDFSIRYRPETMTFRIIRFTKPREEPSI